MTIVVRNRDSKGDVLGIIETEITTPQMIIEIMDEVSTETGDYNIDDVIERLPSDCIWFDVENNDVTIYF